MTFASLLRAALLAAPLLAACGPSNQPAGAGCSDNSECAQNLSCLAVDTVSSASCRRYACSTTCSTDADCRSLGTKFKCLQRCGGVHACVATSG